MKLLLIVSLCLYSTLSYANTAEYCLAIRGNGQSAPAHWGASAQIVEKLGLPQKQAGGSSAVITMTLFDGIATNPYTKTADVNESNLRSALLIKSLHGFLGYLTARPEWKEATMLFGSIKSAKDMQWLKNIQDALSSADPEKIASIQQMIQQHSLLLNKNIQTGLQLGIINPDLYGPLVESIQILTTANATPELLTFHLKRSKFYISELQKTLEVFGKFNAQTDVNLFFRPGIISFEGLAEQVGKIAEFYAAESISEKLKISWQNFFTSCTPDSSNKTWEQIATAKPNCQLQLAELIDSYFKERPDNSNNFAQKITGKTIPSYPITSVLTAQAYTDANQAITDYKTNFDSLFGNKFKIQNPNEVKIGYWGSNTEELATQLPKGDAKSEKFLSLGQTTWFEALRLSPAEPGLSAIKPFSANNAQYISAGGWPDLEPTLILKAAGCDNVVYLTRQGGESLFAMGVAQRLLNLNIDINFLKTEPEEVAKQNSIINNTGLPEDLTSDWSTLYNMANPESSLQKSLKAADAIVCTDWNSYDPATQLSELITNAFISPIYVAQGSPLLGPLKSTVDTEEMHPDGYAKNAGCFPGF